jgi:integrase
MARKGNQDRGLFERPKGSDIWWIRYADDTGREHRERIGRKGLARAVYEKRKTEAREGRYFPPARKRAVRFNDLLEDYRAASARQGKAIMRTDAGYRRALEAFGGRRIETIAASDVEAWRDRLAESLSPASVAHYLTMLRAIFNRAVRDGKIASSPTRGVEWPEENNARVRYLSEIEERRLIKALPKRRRALVTFAINTGLRLGEILKLRWSDIDTHSASIHVREAKSGEGRRLPLNQFALAALNQSRRARPKVIQLEARRKAGEGGCIFGPDGPTLRMSINRDFRRATLTAKIQDLRFHDLRHTFASRLVMRGFDLYRVQTLLGHKTARMTQRYAHLSPEGLREAVDALCTPLAAATRGR